MFRRSVPAIITCFLAACGGSDDTTSSSTVPVTIGFSDAPVENLSAVVVAVDAIILKTEAGEEIRLDDFTNADDPNAPLSQFQINLLDYQGSNYKVVAQDLLLEPGTYQGLTLEILDDDIADSYVTDDQGAVKPIKVPSDTLKLGGFTVAESGVQTFIVEFDLRQAMTYNPGPDRYILKPRGVRVIESAASATVSGTVDLAYVNALEPCASKTDSTVGNVMYLYSGHDLAGSTLLDQLEPDVTPQSEGGSVAPYTSVGLDELGQYEVAFLPPGDYTLAFSCTAQNDDPDLFDNLEIPSPADATIEITLGAGETRTVNYPVL